MTTEDVLATLRALVQRGVLHRLDDTGAAQAVDVETAEGVLRSAAEVLQPPGLACNPGTLAAVALVLAPGGDSGVPVVILSAPGARMGKLAEGETAIYALDGGARVHAKPGGEVLVLGAQKVTTDAPEVITTAEEVTITATTKATVTAPEINLVGAVKVTGSLRVNGSLVP